MTNDQKEKPKLGIIKRNSESMNNLLEEKNRLRQREEFEARLDALAKEQRHAHSGFSQVEKTIILLLETLSNQEERIFALENSLKK